MAIGGCLKAENPCPHEAFTAGVRSVRRSIHGCRAIPSSADKPRSGIPAHRIGCAGWSILSRHAALFGEGDSHLARYATRFNAVEINSSFYRPHAATTYARWAASVPRSFRFSVKLPKAITHDARLRGAGSRHVAFAGRDRGAGQAPRRGAGAVAAEPGVRRTHGQHVLRDAAATDRGAGGVRTAARQLVRTARRCHLDALRHRARRGRSRADSGGCAAGRRGSLGYWRWHGSPRMYYDSYDDGRLRAFAAALRDAARPKHVPWCIFDNTAAGHAIANAARLQELLALP